MGIDLGTTNSLIGVMESGFPILLADEEGARMTPSVVHFPKTGEPLVGRAAQRTRAIAPRETIYSIKRFMGEPRVGGEEMDYEIVSADDGLRVRGRGQQFSPEEISALILRKLKSDAERALGRAVTRAVISVPAYFNDAQRHATKRAGELAGFIVERIINEPTAAALAYGLERGKTETKIAVFDLGGGTFDLSILKLNEGIFEVLATNGNTRLGGDDIDRALLEFVIKRERLAQVDRARLREALIDAKHRLSTEERVMVLLPFAGEKNVEIALFRDELEKISRPVLEKARWHCDRALADANLRATDLDEVILVGGATRMPMVQQLAREIFQCEPNVSQHPDETVALGATLQAGILSGAVRDVVLLDVTPLSLGIETFGGLMNVIIPRNSTIPTKAGEMFTTAVSQQRAMSLKVLQGEREMARDNWSLGEFEIEFAPAPKGVPRVGVQFEIDVNGILHVLARDTATGAEKELALSSAVDVSDEVVEKMLEDSLEHAFEDVGERARTEAKLKAEEMLAAIESALAAIGDALPAEERTRIESASADVRSAMAAESLPRLQTANRALDVATQNLAALVVEKAMREETR